MRRMVSVALALVMIFALAVSVSAEISPTGKAQYGIVVKYDPADGSLGTANGDKDSVIVGAPDEEGNVTLTAVKKPRGIFAGWEISGDYDLVKGTLKDTVIVVKPKSDITALAKFVTDSTPDQPKPTEKPNNGNTSPKTGDPLFIVIGFAVLALGAGAVAVKKIKG